MGPVVGVPVEVAQRIKDETDLVEVDDVRPDVVDEPDVQMGARPFGDLLLLAEAPRQGYGQLVDIIAEYAKTGSRPFELTVIDQHGQPNAFPAHSDVTIETIRDHLKLGYYGEPGDRRPLIRDGDPPSSRSAVGPSTAPLPGETPIQWQWSNEGVQSMDDGGHPISYEALEAGTSVVSSTGNEFGTVEHVLQIPSLDLFDGIVVKTKKGARFVDRDQITDITTTQVRCALTDQEAGALPSPQGTRALRPDASEDEGHSLTAWYGRTFGRQHWKQLD